MNYRLVPFLICLVLSALIVDGCALLQKKRKVEERVEVRLEGVLLERALEYERQGDSYVFRTSDVAQIAAVLKNIIDKDWVLIDLSVRQSALEDMYVKLMDGEAD